jgi:hypothetical protein
MLSRQLVASSQVTWSKNHRLQWSMITALAGAVFVAISAGVDVFGTTAYINGKAVIQPPAIEAWRATLSAVRVLLSGSSSEGYMYDVVTANLSIIVLVTGFETYCKRRFLELEQEGITPDIDALFSIVLKREEKEKRRQGEVLEIEQEAAAKQVSLIQHLADQRLNFQDFDRCKRYYNKAYGIKFGQDLNLGNAALEEVQRFIKARHRIIHVTPLTPMIFEPGKMDEETMEARTQRDWGLRHLHQGIACRKFATQTNTMMNPGSRLSCCLTKTGITRGAWWTDPWIGESQVPTADAGTLPRHLRRLANEAGVALDGPRPSPELEPNVATLSRRSPRRPCHSRAVSDGQSRSSVDNHGYLPRGR